MDPLHLTDVFKILNDLWPTLALPIGFAFGFWMLGSIANMTVRMFGFKNDRDEQWEAQAEEFYRERYAQAEEFESDPRTATQPLHAQMAKQKMTRRKPQLPIFFECPKCGARRTSTPCEWCGTVKTI